MIKNLKEENVSNFKIKYLKYKQKYLYINKILNYKKLIGGNDNEYKNELKNYILGEIKKFCSEDSLCNIINNNIWNWNTIKKKSSPENMKKFFDFRLSIVNTITTMIFNYYGCDKLLDLCDKSASGSIGIDANIYSDYDLTVVNQNMQTTKIIKMFNSVIQNTFGATPFEVFDTNLYGYSCMIPYTKLFKNTKTWKLFGDDKIKKYYYIPLTQPNINQDKWAIRRLTSFIKESKKKLPFEVKYIEENRELYIINKNKSDLYIDKMIIFEELMKQYQDNKINDNDNIVNIQNKIIDSLSFMNYYGDETYFTIGSFMHVVGTMFYYRNIDDDYKMKLLNKSHLIHSMIENLAYFIHSFEKSNDIIIAVKYLERFMNAYKLFKKIKNNTLFDLLNELKSKFRNTTDDDIRVYLKNFNLSSDDINVEKNKRKSKLSSLFTELTKIENKDNDTFVFYIKCLLELLLDCINSDYTFIKLNKNNNNYVLSLLI